MKANFINYTSVWGNPKDGYTVDDSTVIYENVELPNLEDTTLIKYLKQRKYLTAKANKRNIRIEDMYPMLEVVEIATDYPLGRFEIVEE